MTFKLLVYSGAVAFKLLELCGNPPVGCAASPPLHKGAEAWVGAGGISFPEGYQLLLSFHAAFGRYEKR